jgi:hypothetical protein
MPKDFALSYEQLCWKHAVTSHARLSEFVIKYSNNAASKTTFTEEIKKLELKYPVLKKGI